MNRATIILLTLLAMAGHAVPVSAEDDLRALIKALSAQVSALNDQVRQSNQRIAELERKLQKAEQDKQQPAPAQASGTAPGGRIATAPSPAGPATTTTTTTAAPAAPAATGREAKPPVTVGDAKGTLKIPGTDTSIGFGGFAKLDTSYSSVSAGRDRLGDQVLLISQIPVGDQRLGENSELAFHAKDSRLWFKSFTPSSWGDINTFVELDFFGSTETYTYTPRIRHVYGSIGNFLAGYTWSTFLNTFAIPDTLDNTASAGSLTNTRQPVVRWTQPFSVAGEPLDVQVAAEAPQSRFWADAKNGLAPNVYGFATPHDERYPDLVVRLNYTPRWGSLSLSGMGRQIRYAPARTSGQQEQWGGAVSLAGRVTTVGLDNARFMLSYGDVLGRYGSLNTFEDATLDANGQMQLINSYSAMLAYQHWWDNAWRSTLAYGFTQEDQPQWVDGDITRRGQSVLLNLLWSPVLQTTFGLEYIYATRTTVAGESGDLHRVLFSTRFNF